MPLLRQNLRNPVKLRAIVESALVIDGEGFDAFKLAVLNRPLVELRRLPQIGPITVWHLAKNLGLDVAKPDRHLSRIAASLGFDDADHFCTAIGGAVGEQKKVVDLIVWRYLAEKPNALSTVCSQQTN